MSHMIDLAARTIAARMTATLAEDPAPSTDAIKAIVIDVLNNTTRDAAKADAFDTIAGDGTPVLVMFDSRVDGVDVPMAVPRAPKVTLRFGANLNPPIPDMFVDAEHVRGTLMFGGVPYLCVIPWRAVYGVVADAQGDARTAVWPECIPPDVMNVETKTEAPPPPKARGNLKLVD